MSETESQKAIREAIAAMQQRRQVPPLTMVDGVPEAPGEDCPECHGRPRRKACGTCQI